MGKVIQMKRGGPTPPGREAAPSPWEFRRADWTTVHFVQMLRPLADQMKTEEGVRASLAPHYVLQGGLTYTIRAMYANRHDENRMREIYYLVGLTDCMINQVNPILRTDLLRALYKEVFALKKKFNIHWHGILDQVLLPIDSQFHNEAAYRVSVHEAETLKGLYRTIREATEEMFDILSLEYVFYSPRLGD